MKIKKLLFVMAVSSLGYVSLASAEPKADTAEYFLRELCLVNQNNPQSVAIDPSEKIDAAPAHQTAYLKRQLAIARKVHNALSDKEKAECNTYQDDKLHSLVLKHK
ncbi:hypothetical protein [Pantoea sp. Fr+CA_20]|uniref:hypothetical protein n=1 Tax=Pantoea sp. Fr+CA_20 TaxID=2929506 RepID=UPI0021188D1A|nr:hypothetical protein [Pantoea sp. Fr+CA_20]